MKHLLHVEHVNGVSVCILNVRCLVSCETFITCGTFVWFLVCMILLMSRFVKHLSHMEHFSLVCISWCSFCALSCETFITCEHTLACILVFF